MTKAAFLDAIRQYASLARRQRRSYAEAVHVVARARAEWIAMEFAGTGKEAAELSKMQEVLAREYGVNDNEFAIRSYD